MAIARITRVSRTITLLITIFSLSSPAYAQYSGGTGEPNDPYQIATAEDLIALGETPEDYDKHFILTAEIDLDPNLPGGKVFNRAVIAWEIDPNDKDSIFQGIPFAGVFDGNGHSIYNLKIKGGGYLGLFGRLEFSSKVKYLSMLDVKIDASEGRIGGLAGESSGTIIGCHAKIQIRGQDGSFCLGGLVGDDDGSFIIDCSSSGEVHSGNQSFDIGGLVGENQGTITDSNSSVSISVTLSDNIGGLVGHNGGTITNCYSIGNVYNTGEVGGNECAGGLVGDNAVGAVTQCYSTGTVTGDRYIGGLVGWNCAKISMSYSTSTVSGNSQVGGLVGESQGPIATSYSTGMVSGDSFVGGLVGYNYYEYFGGGIHFGDNIVGTINNCYSVGPVTGNAGVGGLVGNLTIWTDNGNTPVVKGCFWDIEISGQTTSDGGIGKTTSEMQDPNTFMDAGWDFVGQSGETRDIWVDPEDGGYPILWWQLVSDYDLPNFSGGSGVPDDPYLIAKSEELMNIGHDPRLIMRHFELIEDLNLKDLNFYPIGSPDYPFRGVFDGNGHVISHLTIEGKDYLGLFGFLGNEAEVKDLGITDVNITSSGQYVGGLVGWNEGSIATSYSTGVVSGDRYIGCLVGFNSWSNVATSYSTGTVSGDCDVGGLVGSNFFGSITTSYSSGTVSGNMRIGGLVGDNFCGTITTSFWDIETSDVLNMCGGQNPVSTGCDDSFGRTTSDMQTASTFLEAGWDFVDESENGTENIWWIGEGKDYPRLWWELGISADHPDYDEWLEVGEPVCWCYKRHCHGDTDGKPQGKQQYWVSADDLDVLIAAWNKPFAEIDGQTVNGAALICADFDHKAQGKENYRVSTDDLDILIANWNLANAPAADCP